ncbi:MAG TPA: hypothetical protein VGR32_03675 [Brevundimonas sp.]|jgi:hypothetical protein|uniref:hypothetical protein n=1 Tax=Brevundimonas sp. TaxID=1871086 RepID=UPI002DE790C5|nr:hypothetical protein [Brevundimonas sp.]
MAALSTAHRAALTALVDQCPDAVLTRLVRVVPQMGGGGRASELMAILEEAMRNRRRRAVAFAPFLPLFQPREDGVEGLTFPRVLLGRLWSAAVQGQEAHLPLLDERDGSADRVADRLCRAAAGALRDRPDEIWPPGLTPDTRERDLAELSGCLDLAPLARQGARQLPDWLKAGGGDRTGLRLLLKDAASIAPDGATRLVEILFAHLAEAPAILRIVTRTASAAAREEFLEGSELADFVARIVRAVRVRTEGAEFDPDGGAEAVAATVAGLRWAADALTQIDISLETDPAGDWSREIGVVRRGLTARLGTWMRDADRAVRGAAPRARVRLGGRNSRQGPDLDTPLEPATARRAVAHAAFLASLRGPAATFGCEGDRKASVEAATKELADWADEAIHAVNAGETADEDAALARIAHVAEVLNALEAVDAARTVKRRLAVAGAHQGEARSA